ncbi:hypothetical protein EKG37_22535 [Robertmurraya yapensis]|uniref:NADH dehydrogenase subunit 5 C-terminal domain-containing protein n=1 Tax=Bacillus yapensis TaxID=2492960 RepID=A0A431VRB0_9BACI|nr:hypothetical protein EKG37_22535 [Bacillus yapensis]TKS93459.1 hypothetical protein FAR12_22540 [Bacillus yapensis]
MLAGLFITSNFLPTKTPIITIPITLKLSALLVTALGLLIALELTSLTNKQLKITPTIPLHNFSNMLGYFPSIIHRLAPKIKLSLGQTIATHLIDQT